MAVKQIGESVAPVFSSAFLSFLPQLQMTPSSFPSLTKRNCCNWRHTHTKHREELKMQQISPTGFFIVVQIIQIFDTANNTNIENANNTNNDTTINTNVNTTNNTNIDTANNTNIDTANNTNIDTASNDCKLQSMYGPVTLPAFQMYNLWHLSIWKSYKDDWF